MNIRRFQAAIITILFSLSIVLSSCINKTPLSDGLYSYLPLDDKNDPLGHATTGRIGDTSFVPSLVGRGLSIPTDYDNTMIYFGESVEDRDNTYSDLLNNSGTLNVWIYLRSLESHTDGTMTIIGGNPAEKEDNGGCEENINHWELAIVNVPGSTYGPTVMPGSESIRFVVPSYTDIGDVDKDTRVSLTALKGEIEINTWYMITVTHNQENNEWKLFVNSNLVESKKYHSGIGKRSIRLSCPYALGNRPLDKYGRPFSGIIDEVGFWKRALSSKDIERLYNEGDGLAFEEFRP
jgi:hypothetical protein